MRSLGPLRVCPIGFGTWGLGGVAAGAPPAYGPTDDEQSKAALRQAQARGLNFYDTSALYGAGHAESLLGEVLDGSALIASKAGYRSVAGDQNFEEAHLLQEIRASLGRLRRNQLDLFMLHDPPPSLLHAGLFEELEKWRKEGLIGCLGISLRHPQDALEVVGRWPVQAVQLNYSLTDQRARQLGVLEHCARHGVGVIARTPLGFGFLAAPVATDLPVGDHRTRFGLEQRGCWGAASTLFRAGLVESYPGSDAQLALAFCLAQPEISVAIPGMLTSAQVDENLDVLQLPPLSSIQVQSLQKIYAENTFMVTPKA